MGMFEYGVAGYLTKDEAPDFLDEAVRGISLGEET
jgi:DNA-binding NarL/FixJ family response regulator